MQDAGPPESQGPAGSLENLPVELKRMVVRQFLMMLELPQNLKAVNWEFNSLSNQEFNEQFISWGNAYKLLQFRFGTLDKEVLELIACCVLDIDEDKLNELHSKTLNIQKIFEIAAHCFLSLPPFNFDVYLEKQTVQLSLTYVSATPTQLIYNHTMQLRSRGLLLEDFEAFVFSVCHGALEELRELAFESSESNKGVTKFFSSVSNSALPELDVLRIENNRLGDDGMRVISTALTNGALKSLRRLEIAENEIGDVGMSSFSEAISDGAARSLERLSITGNRIGGAAFFSALSKLSAEQTRLSAPPDTAIAPAHTQLHTLDLVCNQIGDDGIVQLSKVLSTGVLPKLKHLWLGCNRIGDEGVIELVSALSIELQPASEIEVLENLGLDGNPIGERGMKRLLSGLFPQDSQYVDLDPGSTMRKRLSWDIKGDTTKMTRTEIWCSNDTFDWLIHTIHDLKFQEQFFKRTIQVDDMSLNAIHAIVEGRSSPPQPNNLRQAAEAVDLNYRSNTGDLVDKAYNLLRMCAYYKLTRRQNMTATQLAIPSFNLDGYDFKAVCFALCSGVLRNLTKIDGSSRHLNDEATVTLSSTIATGTLTELVDLRLNCNDIGDNGMIAFADAIKPSEAQGKLANLDHLDISYNRIGDKGMGAFSFALGSGALASLTHLVLDSNQIGDAGITAFAGAIRSGALASLEALYLDSNQIGDGGMKAFSGALSYGALPELKQVVVQSGHEYHTQLVAACEPRGIVIS